MMHGKHHSVTAISKTLNHNFSGSGGPSTTSGPDYRCEPPAQALSRWSRRFRLPFLLVNYHCRTPANAPCFAGGIIRIALECGLMEERMEGCRFASTHSHCARRPEHPAAGYLPSSTGSTSPTTVSGRIDVRKRKWLHWPVECWSRSRLI